MSSIASRLSGNFKLTPLVAVLLTSLSALVPQHLAAAEPNSAALPDLGTASPKADVAVSAAPGGMTLGTSLAQQKFFITPQYSSETGASLGITLASMLGEDAAVGVLLNAGAHRKEWLINAGYKIDERQRFIVTAGQLKQFLDYAFRSGKENVGMTQSSGAVSYQLQLGKEFLRFLEVNGYVAKTTSRDLADKTFIVDNNTILELWNDPRRIAGGRVSGLQGTLGFSPVEGGTVKVSIGHERLSYDLLAGKDSTNRVTGGIEWLQQLPHRLWLRLSADSYASQNRYSIGLNRSLNGVDGGRHNLGFAIDSIRGRDGLGNDTQYKLIYSYTFGSGNRSAGTNASLAAAQDAAMPNGALSANDQTATSDTLLNQVAQRPSVIPDHVIAKIDTTAAPTMTIAGTPPLGQVRTGSYTLADANRVLKAVSMRCASGILRRLVTLTTGHDTCAES